MRQMEGKRYKRGQKKAENNTWKEKIKIENNYLW
jgi:hypothetical protein